MLTVQLFFPDPWHKARHHKRRIVQLEFVEVLRKKLKIGGDRNRRAPDVIHDGREMRVAKRQHPQVFANSAKRTDLGLGNVQPSRFQQAAPAPAIELRLAAGDVHSQPRAKLAVAVVVLGGHGFLEPIGVQL